MAISSPTIDLPLVTVRAPAASQIASTAARASAAVRHQWTWPPRRMTLRFPGLEIEIEMRDDVVLDVAAVVAQRLELRQLRHHLGAARGEALAHHEAQRLLQRLVAERAARVLLEVARCRLHQRRRAAPIGG